MMARRLSFGPFVAILPTGRDGMLKLAALALVLAQVSSAAAQLPKTQLLALFPAGAQRAVATPVQISAGTDLDGVNQLHFSHPGIVATQVMAPVAPFRKTADPQPGAFSVAVAADVPPGIYEVRAAGRFGLSNPRAFVVGELPELREKAPNNTPETATEVSVGSVINGNSDGATFDYFKFKATAGQRIVIDCWAQRIDSMMDATMSVLDAQGVELIRSRDVNRRDPLIDLRVPADGEYTLKVNDFVYRGGADSYYRITIGTAPYIDMIMPPAALAGGRSRHVLYGRNLPGGVLADGVTVEGQTLERLEVDIDVPATAAGGLQLATLLEPEDGELDAMEYRLPSPLGLSNPAYLGIATAAVIAETEPNDQPALAQVITLPAEVAGQFYPRQDSDWYSFTCKQGETYWLEVISQRMGLPTDPSLVVQRVTKDDKGQEQVTDLLDIDDDAKNVGGAAFNTTTADPAVRFVAPADGVYRVLVRNLHSNAEADPRNVYRLSIRVPQPDFRLAVTPKHLAATPQEQRLMNPVLRRGGNEVFDVVAYRRDGFDGDITIQAEGLPEGVTAAPITIGAGTSSATLVVAASEAAPAWSGTFNVAGVARVGEAEVKRLARGGSLLWVDPQNQGFHRSRITRNIGLSVLGAETAAFTTTAGPGQPLEISRGGKLEIPVTVARRGEVKQNITLSAVGLPANIQPTNLVLDGATNAGNFVLQFAANSPLGTYSFLLQGQTAISYRRDPESIALATTAQQEVDAAVAEAVAASQAADLAKQLADQLAATTATAAQQAADAYTAAQTAAQQTAAESQAAAAKATQDKAAADANAGNADLAAAAAASAQAAVEAATRAQTAETARVAAEKVSVDAAAAAKAAADTKVAADAQQVAAAAQAKAGADAKVAVDKRLADVTAAANPKDVNVFEPSTPVTIKVTAAPITLAPPAPAAAIAAGGMAEVPVAITRLYGFADVVDVEVQTPNGVAGLQIDKVQIPGDQSAGKLVVKTAANATPGTHTLLVRCRLKYNGIDLQVEQPLAVTVAAAAAQ